MADTKVRISFTGWIRRLFWICVFLYVVMNPLGAAMAVHNVATWAFGLAHGAFS